MRWQRIWLAVPIFSLVIVLAITTVTQGLSQTLPDDPNPARTFLGIGYYRNFDGYAAEVGVYYDTWNSNRTIDIRGSLADIYTSSNCKSHNPTMIGKSWSPSETYATVTLTVTNGGSLTYNITRDNFCRHIADGALDEINSRTSPNSARFVGRYQLPNTTPSEPDEETGKYKVAVKISFTPKVVDGYNSAGDYINPSYNPNAFFRVRAIGGLVAAVGSTDLVTDLRKLNTRVYTNVEDYFQQTVEFGSPCSLTSGQVARFGIYDPDNYFHTGAISGTQGWSRPFLFYLEELSAADQAAGITTYTPLASSRYTIVGGSSRGLKVTRASLNARGLTTSLPNGITAIESTTRIPDGDGANSPSTVVDFTPEIDAKYRLRMIDVYTMNFLQIVVPFDGIYSAIDCDTGTEVEPGVSLSPSMAALGEAVNATAWIRNRGSVNSGEVNYRYRVWLDQQGDGLTNPGPGPGDQDVQDNSGTRTVGPGGTVNLPNFGPYTVTNGSMAQVCVGLWLTEVGSTTVANSPAIACSPIGRYPQTQISGGDVIADGQVSSVAHTIDSHVYGSWVEYSIFAAGNVNSISAAALPASGYDSSYALDRAALTFANTTPTPGNFAPSPLAFDGNLGRDNGVWRGWSDSPLASGTIDSIDDLDPHTINYFNGDITISANLDIDESYVIHAVGGSVVINRSVEYDDATYTSLDSLPQLVIIADDFIRIHPNANRVDAWLIAGSRVLTCAGPGATNPSPYYLGLNSTNCNDQLVINGPVQSGALYLRRTGGAGAAGSSVTNRSTPAEVINLRSDAYLWAYGQASQGQTIRTDSVKELPPRF